MSFAVFLHPKAAKELKRLAEDIRARIAERAREPRDRPEQVGKRLSQSDF